MRVSRSCCSGGRYGWRKVTIWGTHLPGAWTILDVKVWNRTTTDRCRSMAASVSWDSCSRRAWRWLNISCLKGQHTIHSEHQYRKRAIKSQYTQNTNTCTEKMSVTFIWNLQLGTMKSVPPYLKLTKYINSLCSW